MPTEISGSTGVNKIQDNTIVNADINSSAAIAGSKLVMPTGSILQVVQTEYTTNAAFSSTTLVAHGASATITPTSTSSKMLITSTVHHQSDAQNGTDAGLGFAWKRGSTTIWQTAQGYAYYFYPGGGSGGDHENRGWIPLPQYIDSPNTTSATTYALWARRHGSSATHYFQGSDHPTTITLMEIAG